MAFLRLIAFGVVLVFPTVMAVLNFVILPGDESGARQIFIPAGKFIQFTLPVVCLVWRPTALVRQDRVWWGLWAGIGFGVGVGGGLIGIYYLFLQESPVLEELARHLFAFLTECDLATRQGFLTLGVSTAVLHSLLEEYYWRWFVFRSLRRYGVATALILSSVGFAAYHVFLLMHYFPESFFSIVMPISLAIAAGGLYWGWLYHKTRSLTIVWISHLLVDAGLVFVEYQLLFGYW